MKTDKGNQSYSHRPIIRLQWLWKTKADICWCSAKSYTEGAKKELAQLCLPSAASLCFPLTSTAQCCDMGQFCCASLACFYVWSSALANWVCSSLLGFQRALSAVKQRAEEYTGQKTYLNPSPHPVSQREFVLLWPELHGPRLRRK